MNVWGQQNDYKIAFQGSRGFGILTEAEEIGGIGLILTSSIGGIRIAVIATHTLFKVKATW
jgi:hypothetical protein